MAASETRIQMNAGFRAIDLLRIILKCADILQDNGLRVLNYWQEEEER